MKKTNRSERLMDALDGIDPFYIEEAYLSRPKKLKNKRMIRQVLPLAMAACLTLVIGIPYLNNHRKEADTLEAAATQTSADQDTFTAMTDIREEAASISEAGPLIVEAAGCSASLDGSYDTENTINDNTDTETSKASPAEQDENGTCVFVGEDARLTLSFEKGLPDTFMLTLQDGVKKELTLTPDKDQTYLLDLSDSYEQDTTSRLTFTALFESESEPIEYNITVYFE